LSVGAQSAVNMDQTRPVLTVFVCSRHQAVVYSFAIY